MNEKYFVIAGYRDQYLNFMKKKSEELWNQGNTSISLSHFIYATVDNIRGIRNPSGWFIGTWYERDDAYDILYALIISTDDSKKLAIINGQMNYLLTSTKNQIKRVI
jgi:hypothetical protein